MLLNVILIILEFIHILKRKIKESIGATAKVAIDIKNR